jgi:thymidine kinase
MKVLRLEIIAGCMFAGKTRELMRRAARLRSIGKKVVMINHSNDTRGENQDVVRTHDEQKEQAIKTNLLMPLINIVADAICIDEGQFFPDLIDFIHAIETRDITVIVSGLDGDMNRKPFRQITDLIPMAESFDKLHALEKLPNGDVVTANYSMLIDGDVAVIGGADKYKAVCRETYLGRRQREE